MENLFYNFGFIYIIHSFYKMYNWKYGDKISVIVDENTTLNDIKEISNKIESAPKTFMSVIAKINTYLCFLWLLLGAFYLEITEQFYFRILVAVIVIFYIYMLSLGFLIGYKSSVNYTPHTENDLDENQNKSFPLCYMIEVTKILIVSFVLFKHFI